jgi:hypothetical protein
MAKLARDNAEDASDQVKPMICFDTEDLVGGTFLMEKTMIGCVAALALRLLMATSRTSLTTLC